MVGKGDGAPDFEAASSTGQSVRLSALRGHPVVLFFYPKAHTSGCTIETRAFGEMNPELEKRGVRVLGISVDDVPAQTSFAQKCGATFPLVADTSKGIARSYGVLGLTGVARRVTFFIGPDGRIVDSVDSSRPAAHFDRAKALYLSGA